MKNLVLFTFMCLFSFALAACNTENIDEAVENSDNPEVSNLVHNDDRDDNAHEQSTEGRLNVADEVADQVNGLEEIKDSWVFVTEENAFVAVKLNEGASEEIPEDIKNKVAEEVKASDGSIENVYVSSNPDFADRFNEFGVRIDEGEPIEGIVEEFNQTVQRIFPDVS